MTEEHKVVKRFESFVLGFCRCGCGTEIKIKGEKTHYLIRYIRTHAQRGRKGRSSNGYKNGISYRGDYKLLFRPHHKYIFGGGYVLEHRYIIELQLGRYLTKTEVVHHKDKNPKNNDLSNLELLDSQGNHMSIHNPKIDMSGRCCHKCGSYKTKIEKEYNTPHWHYIENNLWCHSCYSSERRRIRKILIKNS